AAVEGRVLECSGRALGGELPIGFLSGPRLGAHRLRFRRGLRTLRALVLRQEEAPEEGAEVAAARNRREGIDARDQTRPREVLEHAEAHRRAANAAAGERDAERRRIACDADGGPARGDALALLYFDLVWEVSAHEDPRCAARSPAGMIQRSPTRNA